MAYRGVYLEKPQHNQGIRSALGRCYIKRPDIMDPRNGFGSVLVKADNQMYETCVKLDSPPPPPFLKRQYSNVAQKTPFKITGTSFADGEVGFCCGDVDDLQNTGNALSKDPVVQALFCDNYGVFKDMVPDSIRSQIRAQMLSGVLAPLPSNLMLPGMVGSGIKDKTTGEYYYYNLHDTICGTSPVQARSTDTRDRSVTPFKPTAPPFGPNEHTFPLIS